MTTTPAVYDFASIRQTTPAPQLVAVLRRLADKAILPLEDEDPLLRAAEEYQRLWAFSAASLYDDDDDDPIQDDVREIAHELERHIIESVATTKSALVAQARIAQHEQFPDYLLPDLIDTLVRGIVALVRERM
jgi:hypothetical protein